LNAEIKERFDILSQLGCCICRQPPQIHHLIGIKYRGMGQKADDVFTIPLCLYHHTGPEGIHTLGKRAWEAKYGFQDDWLEETERRIECHKQTGSILD
jgi:hypothetical protein